MDKEQKESLAVYERLITTLKANIHTFRNAIRDNPDEKEHYAGLIKEAKKEIARTRRKQFLIRVKK